MTFDLSKHPKDVPLYTPPYLRPPYTLADRAWAVEYLQSRDVGSGNNPNSGRCDAELALDQVARIDLWLKENGLLPWTPAEELNNRLDRAFPDARSKQVVQFEGKTYRRWYLPARMSRSGKTVVLWDCGWEEVKP